MPQNGPTASRSEFALTFLFLLALAGSVRAWAWAIGRWRRGQPLLEEGHPRTAPWGGYSVLAVVGLYLAGQWFVLMAYSGARRAGFLGSPAAGAGNLPAADLLGIMLVSNALVVLLTPWLLRLTCGARAADFGVDRAGVVIRDLRRGFVGCLMIAPVVYALYLGVQFLWPPEAHPAVEAIRGQASGVVTLMVAISAVVAAPMAEELVFRGVLLGWLTRVARLGSRPAAAATFVEAPDTGDTVAEVAREAPDDPREDPLFAPAPESAPPKGPAIIWGPNILVSALFAAVHAAQWPAPVPLFLLSLALGWLYQRTGRLGGPVAMHATFNGFSTAVLLLAPAEPPPPVPNPAKAGGREVSARPEVGSSPQPGRYDPDHLTTRPRDLDSVGRTLGSAEDPQRRDRRVHRGLGEIGGAGNLTIGLARGGPWMRNARRSSVTCPTPWPATGLPREGPRFAT